MSRSLAQHVLVKSPSDLDGFSTCHSWIYYLMSRNFCAEDFQCREWGEGSGMLKTVLRRKHLDLLTAAPIVELPLYPVTKSPSMRYEKLPVRPFYDLGST